MLQHIPTFLIMETYIAQLHILFKRMEFLRLGKFLDGIVCFQDKVYAVHGCQAMGYLIRCLGQVLQRIYHTVQNHHVEDEGGGIYHVGTVQDEPTAEPQHYHYYSRTQKLRHGVSGILPYHHLRHLPAVFIVLLIKTLGHLLLRNECLDDAQSAQCLVQMGDDITPAALYAGRLALQFSAYLAHHPSCQRCNNEDKQRQLPTDRKQGNKAYHYGYGLTYHHIHRRHNRSLHTLHIGTHAGYDVAFPLLGEETQRKFQHLVIQLRADIPNHSGTQRHHHSTGSKVAKGLYTGHQHQGHTHDNQGEESPVLVYQLLHKGIAVVHDHFLGQCVPRPFLIGIYRLVCLEQDVQYRYQHHKGKHVHPL